MSTGWRAVSGRILKDRGAPELPPRQDRGGRRGGPGGRRLDGGVPSPHLSLLPEVSLAAFQWVFAVPDQAQA